MCAPLKKKKLKSLLFIKKKKCDEINAIIYCNYLNQEKNRCWCRK